MLTWRTSSPKTGGQSQEDRGWRGRLVLEVGFAIGPRVQKDHEIVNFVKVRQANVLVLAGVCILALMGRDDRREKLFQGVGTKYTHEVAALPDDVKLIQVFDTSQGLTCVVVSESPRHVKPQDVVQVVTCALKNKDNLRNGFAFLHMTDNAGDVCGWGEMRHVEVVVEPVLNT